MPNPNTTGAPLSEATRALLARTGVALPVAPTKPTVAATIAARERVAVPFQAHSETSKAAAEELEASGEAKSKERQVYEWLALRGSYGATDNEIIEHFVSGYGWNRNTPRARRIGLAQKVPTPMVVDSGVRRDGSAVWIADVVAVPEPNEAPEAGKGVMVS